MTKVAPVRIGVLVWNQYTDWPAMRGAAITADRLGYHSLWTWDHLYPIVGSPEGPILEGYMMLAGWSQVTTHATLGLLVGANTFRNPGLVVKLVTALDHLSEGRAILGLGGAWFDTEHTAFGIDFGRTVGERLDWLDEAVELIHGMLRTSHATARGERYHAVDVRNDPPPIQAHLPHPHRRLRRAQDAPDHRPVRGRVERGERDARGSGPEGRGAATLVRGGRSRHGRDRADREPGPAGHPRRPGRCRTPGGRLPRAQSRHDPGGPGRLDQSRSPSGAGAYVALGFRHIIYHLVPPYDDETLVRFATEVRPAL